MGVSQYYSVISKLFYFKYLKKWHVEPNSLGWLMLWVYICKSGVCRPYIVMTLAMVWPELVINIHCCLSCYMIMWMFLTATLKNCSRPQQALLTPSTGISHALHRHCSYNPLYMHCSYNTYVETLAVAWFLCRSRLQLPGGSVRSPINTRRRTTMAL